MSRMTQKRMERQRTRRGVMALILVLVLLAGLTAWLYFSGRLNAKERALTYNYAADNSTVTCVMGGGVAVATTSGLQVYDSTGLQTAGELFVAQQPMVMACGDYGLCYDIGGTQLRLFDETGILKTLKADGAVMAAAVNTKGWCAVCAEESGYKGAVSVYNASGTLMCKWLSGEARLLAAKVSPDCRHIAVLTLTDSGSRVVFLQPDKEESSGELLLENELLVDIGYDTDGTLYGISCDALYELKTGGAELLYDFTDSTLAAYSFSGGPVLALNAYRSGGECRVIMLGTEGAEILDTYEDGLLSLDADSQHIAVLTDESLVIYNRKNMEISAAYEESVSGQLVTLTDDGYAMVSARNTANAYAVRKDSEEGA